MLLDEALARVAASLSSSMSVYYVCLCCFLSFFQAFQTSKLVQGVILFYSMDMEKSLQSSGSSKLVYTRNQLIALHKFAGAVHVNIPKEVFCFRGCRSGVAVRARRREKK